MRFGYHRRRLLPFLGVAILLHLFLFLFAWQISDLIPDSKENPLSEPLELSLVPDDPKQMQQELRDLQEKTAEEERKDRDMSGQVVDLPKPQEERRPKESRYLSEYDTSVKKETKAPPRPLGTGRSGAPERPKVAVAPPAPPPTPQPAPPEQPMNLAMRQPEPTGQKPLTDRDAELPAAPVEPQPNPVETPRDAESALTQRLLNPDLTALAMGESAPQEAVPGEEGNGAQANDALQDVEEGDETLLNSTRWRYASFFNRVKRQVAQNWHPDRVYRRRDPTGNVYGFRDRLTVLRVRLTPEGRLLEVDVDRGSGVGFLDDEAVSAFRLAEPFPNPPKGLVDDTSGVIEFRFGFMFEIDHGSSFRLFRSLN